MADLLPSIPDASAPEDAEPRVVGLDDEDADDVLGALSSTTARELFTALNDDPAHPSALADRVDTSLQNVQYHLGNLEDAGVVEVVDTAYSEKGREMDVYAPADQPLVLFAGDEEDETLLHRALSRLLGGVGVLAGATLSVRGLVGANESGGETATEEFAGTQVSRGGGSGDDENAAAGADDGDSTDGADDGGAASDSEDAEDADAADGADSDGSSADGTDGGEDAGAETDGEYADGQSIETSEEAQRTGEQVEPIAAELDWVVQPLDATGLPPELAVFLLGACLLAIGTGAWYWRMRQTRV